MSAPSSLPAAHRSVPAHLRSIRRTVPAAVLVLGSAAFGVTPAARADVVHLKNGATIECVAIEERGGDLVLKQKTGTIVVPRADVARIERSAAAATAPRATAPPPAPPPPAPSAGSAALPAPGADPAADARRVDQLRQRLANRTSPDAASDRREIVARLSAMGEASLSARRPDEARRRFEEALTFDASHRRARGGLAAALLALDQPARARTVVEQALLQTPDDPDLLVLLGSSLIRLDRAPEAIAALKRSNRLRPDASLGAQIERLERHQGVESDYRRSEAAHFSVAFDGGATSPDLEAEIVGYLEEQFPIAARLFDYTPPVAIQVVVYPEKEFHAATQAGSDVAGRFDGKVRLASGGLRRLDPWARSVLRHELAHAFIAGKSAGGAPRWLHEGLAQVFEGRPVDTGAESDLASDYEAMRGTSGWGAKFTYASALSFAQYLLAQQGQHALNQVLAEIGRGADVEQAFESVTRDSLAELRAAWGEELVRRHRR